MSWTRLALSNPIATVVGVLLVVLFGALSLNRLPVQLTPEVEKPEITIRTDWRAAAPEEVEAEIIEAQEKVLRGLPGMTELLAKAQRGRAEITMQFEIGHDLSRGLLEVINRLNRVPRYPADADEPVIRTVGGRSRAIAWFIVRNAEGNPRDIQSYQDYAEEVIQTRFERVPGVARSDIFGGRAREVRITFDPYKAAALGIQLPVAARLAGANEDVSGGDVNVGKRQYRLRFTGAFDTEELGDMVLEWRDGRSVRLRDVAEVEVALVDRSSFVISKGNRAIAINAHREIGVNVLDVMANIKQAATELAQGPLERAGLLFDQVYDETLYIYRALAMVRNNLGLGICLAVLVLWWFLRKLRATLMVAITIPISVLTTFMVMDAAGRTLNVISLAGVALAVGMTLDAAIVVLENIVRLRERGEPAHRAALMGPTEVWGALFASTATTVAIFLPIMFLADESGQLFADLALTIAVAVTASLVVALTVIPTAAQQWLAKGSLEDRHRNWWNHIRHVLMRLTDTPLRRVAWIVVLLTIPALVTYQLAPKADYLPVGNRNLVFAFVTPPPGVNIDHIEHEMGQVIAERIRPYYEEDKEPQVKHYFFVAWPGGVFLGARAEDESRIGELIGVINEVVRGFPDTIAFAMRASLFGSFGAGRSIDMNLQGRNVETLLQAGQVAFATIQAQIPGARVRPLPGLELAEPELRLVPDERRISEAGWNRGTMAEIVRALGQGLFVGDYFDGEERLDVVLRGKRWSTPEELEAIPLATPRAGVLPLGELVHLERTAGPNELRRLDRRRTVTLQVTAPPDMPLEVALAALKEKVQPVVEPLLPEDGEIRYSGTADKLAIALHNMGSSFVLAIAILYLLMSALFRSFKDSLLVLMALPLATVGSVTALWLINNLGTAATALQTLLGPALAAHLGWLAGVQNVFQPMDLLTMIGFIILLGLVVNNAILLVHQTRAAERDGMPRREAVEQAIGLRLRPILMTTLTSIFGMLPLLLIPGAGSELYRGLATVIVGGMMVSTAFTLILLPSLLRIGEGSAQGVSLDTEAAAAPAE